MDISDDKSVDFGSVERVDVSPDEVNKVVEVLGLLDGLLLHGMFVAILHSPEDVFHPPGPPHLSSYNGCHGQVLHHPLLPVGLGVVEHLFLRDLLQRHHHFSLHLGHPLFHRLFSLD